MPRRVVTVVLLAAVALLALAACTPIPVASSSATPSSAAHRASPSASSAPSPVARTTVDAGPYLLEGDPGTAGADGTWSGHYGFWLDGTHAIACDVWIFSGDAGRASCAIQPGHEKARTYPLPAGVTGACAYDPTHSYRRDGTAMVINAKIFGPSTTVGFAGCLGDDVDPALDAKRIVLPADSELDVRDPATGDALYSCYVEDGAASCFDELSSFTFGLGTASTEQN
jgi:hypothetical protein